jgi:hypothetical protein
MSAQDTMKAVGGRCLPPLGTAFWIVLAVYLALVVGFAFGLVAILLYLGSGLTHVTPWLIGQSGEVTDAASHVWHVGDLRETTVVILLFTMVFTSMLAGLRLVTDAAERR